jgi:hypothetical protein
MEHDGFAWPTLQAEHFRGASVESKHSLNRSEALTSTT